MGYYCSPDGAILVREPPSLLYQGYPPYKIPHYLRDPCLHYCTCVPDTPVPHDHFVANPCSDDTTQVVEGAQDPETSDTASSPNQCPPNQSSRPVQSPRPVQSSRPVTEHDVMPLGMENVGANLENYNAEIDPNIHCDGDYYGEPIDDDCKRAVADIAAQPLVDGHSDGGEFIEEGAPPSGQGWAIRRVPIRFTNGSCFALLVISRCL